MCRWVITTIGISPGSSPRSRSWAGTSSPGSSVGLPNRAASRPKFSLPVGRDRGVKAGVDEDRAGARVADQEGRDRDRVGGGLPVSRARISFRVRKRPPGLSISAQRAVRRRPATIGSTMTVAPGVPPASGSCSGFGLGVDLHRRLTVRRRDRRLIGLRRPMAESSHSRIFAPGLLEGQVCVVSGAGTGLGRATALELARLGATVIGCGRRAEPLAETAAAGRGPAGPFEREALDIRDEEAVDALLRRRARAPRPPRRARQQRRRPVPQPGRGDHAEGLSHRDRAERPGDLADDPRGGDQGVHPAAAAARSSASPSRPTTGCRGWSTPAPPGPRSRT